MLCKKSQWVYSFGTYHKRTQNIYRCHFFQQQQQLYAEAEESLPPAEEVESDRQQRVYRGQPSAGPAVSREREVIRNSNSIPVSFMLFDISKISRNLLND